MKILEINSVCGIKSTGRIVSDLYDVFTANGHMCNVAYGREIPARVPEEHIYRISSNWGVYPHALFTRITGKSGFYSKIATKKFIKWIKEYDPDVVHLHNIHGYYVNIELLLEYLIETQKKVIFTLHDCWSFTGHCAYFDYCKCEKWRTQCYGCEQKDSYPASVIIDNSKWNYNKKKELFARLNMVVVTPSDWLNRVAQQSFLKEKEIVTINNGVDLTIFRPTESDFKIKNGLQGNKIILGVASRWDKRKGLSDFVKLSKILDKEYKIILVGLSSTQLESLPKDILGISRTNSTKELAELYSVADVFLNPTYEDNFPTTNIEAIACGTPVITYRTGGSPEILDDTCGMVVEKGDIKGVIEKLTQIDKLTESNCILRSEMFDKNEKYLEYLELINEMRV